MKTFSLLICTISVASFVLVATSMSAATLSTDTVLGPNHPYPNETITVVDGDNPPTHVAILDGAIVGGIPGQSAQPIGIDAFGRSEITMFGGFVMGDRAALLHNQSLFRMIGGEIGLIEARDDSKLIVTGGNWGVVGYDSSQIRINGPGGDQDRLVRTFGNSHAMIEGLDEFILEAADSSTVVVKGGEFHLIHALGNSRILVHGGMFTDSSPSAFDNGVVDIWSIDSMADERILAAGNGIVNIYGTGLHFDEIDDHGTLRKIVVGKLADGDDFGEEYEIRDQGQIILHEVPEPGALGLGVVGAAVAVILFRRSDRSWT